ncbi:MAG: error-prone DNA polymerase, partial [Rhodobacterales bacterium]|nr:error-prone DNA polymerase [Rhodobacterales bacterium]
EQVMAMAVAVGGFTAGEADQLRRAMGAWRKRGNLQAMGERLVEGMVERGVDRTYAEQIYKQILGFGEYGFPESHAASFALIVYVSGWLRCHYMPAFTAALINSQPMGFYSPRALLADAQRHGVSVRAVCVMRSAYDCTLERTDSVDAAIRCGFRLVRSLGQVHGKAIEAARAQKPFVGVADFARRTRLDHIRLQALAEADAFSVLGVERRRAAWILQGLWTELPLFAGLERNEPEPALPQESRLDALRADYRAVGLSVHTHPMTLVRDVLKDRGVLVLESLLFRRPGEHVHIAGLVTAMQRPGTASGVVFLTLEDETHMVNVVVWPKLWQKYRRMVRHASMIGVDGQLQRQGDAMSVLVSHFWEVPEPEVGAASSSGSLTKIPIHTRRFH